MLWVRHNNKRLATSFKQSICHYGKYDRHLTRDLEERIIATRIAHTLRIMELLSLFATESDAVTWSEEVRWNGTPTCTHCDNTENLS